MSASSIPRPTLRSALPLSLALHALLALISFRVASTRAPARLAERDVWTAASVEVGVVSEEQHAGTPAPSPPPTPSEPESPAEPQMKQDPSTATPALLEPRKPTEPPALPARPRAAEKPQVAPPPRPRPQSPSPATSPARVASAAPAGTSSANSEANSGSFGAVGLPAGMRHFGKAFARALPASTYSDPRWSELPLGPFESTLVEVAIDEDGKLAQLAPEREQSPSALMRNMIERAHILLKSGVFSLDPQQESAGRERWKLSVSVSESSANPDENAKSTDLYNMGHQPPRTGHPGYARFTLNSGRHVEVVLELLK